MDQRKVAKMTARFESGLLTATEVANSLLFSLVSEPELDTAFLSAINSLPNAVTSELRQLLEKIERADFQWSPRLLTSEPAPSDPNRYSARLRQICDLVREDHTRRANGVARPTDLQSSAHGNSRN